MAGRNIKVVLANQRPEAFKKSMQALSDVILEWALSSTPNNVAILLNSESAQTEALEIFLALENACNDPKQCLPGLDRMLRQKLMNAGDELATYENSLWLNKKGFLKPISMIVSFIFLTLFACGLAMLLALLPSPIVGASLFLPIMIGVTALFAGKLRQFLLSRWADPCAYKNRNFYRAAISHASEAIKSVKNLSDQDSTVPEVRRSSQSPETGGFWTSTSRALDSGSLSSPLLTKGPLLVQ